VRIFLVRHGESVGNVDIKQYRTTPDFAIPLSERGREQAKAAGEFLREHCTGLRKCNMPRPDDERPRMWVSPYTRTRQTADVIEEEMWFDATVDAPGMAGTNRFKLLRDRREHILLVEQQFGLLEGIAGIGDVADHYPDVDKQYKLFKAHGGKFFARTPGGESRFDVAVRVHQAFGTFHRDAEHSSIRTIIVVAHGTVIRCFRMMWLHRSYEWAETEPNPKNGSIHLIANGEDKGCIYEGGT